MEIEGTGPALRLEIKSIIRDDTTITFKGSILIKPGSEPCYYDSALLFDDGNFCYGRKRLSVSMTVSPGDSLNVQYTLKAE